MTSAKVWALDRRVFQQVMKRTGLQRIDDNLKFLRSVPLFERLSTDHMSKIADVLEVVSILRFLIRPLDSGSRNEARASAVSIPPGHRRNGD